MVIDSNELKTIVFRGVSFPNLISMNPKSNYLFNLLILKHFNLSIVSGI